MKIHIVQKGDTLWELSKKYGVNFEELKQMNSQLSSPDMIMPGMKIKIPSGSKAVKQESMPKKETVKQSYKDTSPKPMPVMKEDEKEMPKPQMPQMPQMPQIPSQPIMQMPILEQEFQNYTTINFPEPQHHEKPKKEVKKEMPKEKPKVEAQSYHTPKPQVQMQPQMQPQPQHVPTHMVPMCCHIVHPCYPPVPFQVMAQVSDWPNGHVHGMDHHGMAPAHMHHMQPMHHMHMHQGKEDCGCSGPKIHGAPQQTMFDPMQQQMHMGQQPFQPQMYPPQFEGMSNFAPTPPGYPDFSNRDKDKKESPKSE
ncbi:SafA/ExsA family spore coat assembly protein [Oceanobacillus manasiensis]|uniref:SafA/ExsA family spore coat assembly protein n=1 Tax=Oceanobacillus manasiensis TaxID=586413 RepID=UPI0006945512|nr:SafA/ExsA family spore coat assembly protein [Oceanobacillus manasiensis]